jgi:hypothetical protein
MGRSGVGGGGRSGGGRSGGSRMSSGRSAPHSYGGSRVNSGGPTSHRSAMGSGSHVTGPRPGVGTGSYRSPRPMHTGMPLGGGMYRGGNVVIVNNQNETNTSTNTTGETQSTISNTTTTTQSGKKNSGCLGVVLTITIWIVLISFFFSLVGGVSTQNGDYITKSTINRKKLHLNVSDKEGYFTDECGWIRNRAELEKGLKQFYNSTGVMPYIYIINNVAGDYNPSSQKLEQFVESAYEKLFDDEGHILLLFWDYGGAYEYVLWLGADTIPLMDSEACDILFDYLDYYYYYAETEEAFFADAFAKAGKHMMQVTRSPIYYIMIVGVVGLGIFACYMIWKKRQEKEAARKKRAEEILNTPLEKFGTNGDVIDDLEKKYETEI